MHLYKAKCLVPTVADQETHPGAAKQLNLQDHHSKSTVHLAEQSAPHENPDQPDGLLSLCRPLGMRQMVFAHLSSEMLPNLTA